VNVRSTFFGALMIAGALAACGGGGGGAVPVMPTAAPVSTGTGAPVSINVTFGSSPASMPIPAIAGVYSSATVTLPAGSGTATITASANAPSRTTTLDLAHLHTGTFTTSTSTTEFTTAAYFSITATSAVTIDGAPGLSVTFASAPPVFFLAEFEHGTWSTIAGPASINGDTVTIPITPFSPAVNIASGSSLNFALYTGGTLPAPNDSGCVGVQPDVRAQSGGAKSALVGVQPVGSGSAFNYTGTLLDTIVESTPCAIPTATAAANVSVDVSVTSSPGEPSGSLDEHSVETDAFNTETTTTTTDAIVSENASTQSFSESSETSTDEVGDRTVTTYPTTAPLVYAVDASLPLAGTISNGPPATVNANLADGSTTQRTYASNGAYTENDTIAGLTGINAIQVNADFSGSYTIQEGTGSGAITFAFSAPSAGEITLTQTDSGGTSSGNFGQAIPQWWTGTSLYSDTTTGSAVASLPAPCNPSPAIGSADAFTRTISQIDPVLGFTDTRTITSYVVPNFNGSGTTVGPVCVVISDVENLYYDYFLNTTRQIFVPRGGSADPLQTDTISEAYWFSSAPTIDSIRRADASNPANVPGLAASIATHEAGIAFARSVERAQRQETFERSIVAAHRGGVK
jgi:hypothetical protein